MAVLPTYASLLKAYPDYVNFTSPQVLKLIGGKVEINNFTNTCAVRLSRTLNYNSIELPGPSSAGSMNVVSGKDKKWYAYRVRELRTWLTQQLNQPIFDHSKKQGEDFDKSSIKNYQGIIGFDINFSDATGHLDLWDGSQFTSEKKGLDQDYWKIATRIWIWKTT